MSVSAAICLSGLLAPLRSDPALERPEVRIDLAGRQGMLVQRAARASCFVMGGVQMGPHADMGWIAAYEFGEAMVALRDGGNDSGFAPETDIAIRVQFDQLYDHWQTLEPALMQIIHRDLHTIAIEQVLRLNTVMLETIERAVDLMETARSEDAVEPRLARTLNRAGRQRMLSQKLAKEACFLSFGLGAETQRAALEKTMSEFEATLRDLGEGANGALAPSGEDARASLNEVATLWSGLREILDPVVAGGALNDTRLEQVAELSDALLEATSAVVAAYLSN